MVEDRDTLIRLAAEMMITNHGDEAASIMRDRAVVADRIGDFLSADVLNEVAHAIEVLQAP